MAGKATKSEGTCKKLSLYIIRIADSMNDEAASKYVFCRSVASVDGSSPVYAKLDEYFKPLPPDALAAIAWDFEAAGIQFDGNIHGGN